MHLTKAFRATTPGLLAAAMLAAAPASAGYVATTVASGLNNPRGLAFGPDGGLYITEAGLVSADGPSAVIRGDTWAYNETGSITRLFAGAQTRIVTGLPSFGSFATGENMGPQDIAFAPDGTGYVVIGLGADPAIRTNELGAAPGAANLGTILSFTPGPVAGFSDIAAYETVFNPAGGPLDSNPFRLAALADGTLLTADAGANAVYNVAADGTVSLVSVFPGRDIGGGFPSDAVPTGVAVGPDGAWYVGQLTGFPFTQGAAQIYRVEAGGMPEVVHTGFTNIADIAFGADGSLYVLELDLDGLAGPAVGGALVRVGTDGMRETIYNQGLIMPTGLEIGADGAFYVSHFSVMGDMGEVLRIAAIPEPATWAMLIAGFGLIGARLRRRHAVTRGSTLSG